MQDPYYGYGQHCHKLHPRPGLLGLVILTHPAYEQYLPELLAEVDRQHKFLDQVVLILNGKVNNVPYYPWLTICGGHWNSPQEARNFGLQVATTEWVCYLDGDNVPLSKYYASMRAKIMADLDRRVAVVYPGAVMRMTTEGETKGIYMMPEWNRDIAREKSICDTSSAWRVSALLEVGGWFEGSLMLDDYTTVLQLIHNGWQGQRNIDALSVLRHHNLRRSQNHDKIPETLWRARRHTILTLFAGRHNPFYELMWWYMSAHLPPQTDIEWIDNSDDPHFNDLLWRSAENLRSRVSSVRITKIPKQKDSVSHLDIHTHVAGLYNHALARLTSDVVITLEDDVIPPRRGLYELLAPIQPYSRRVAVAGIYPSRSNPKAAAACRAKDKWQSMPLLSDLTAKGLYPMGMIAGGFTAWDLSILRRFLPFCTSHSPLLGWDGEICARLNQEKYLLLLSGNVRCKHLTK